MNRFLPLLLAELAMWARRPGVHIFAGFFAFLGLLVVASIAGQIEFISLGGFGGQVKADSPSAILSLLFVFSLFAMMNFAAAAGGAATRDVTDGMHALVYSTAVPKGVLLGTRFLGALAVNAWLMIAAMGGLLFGFALPWLEAERVGAFDLVPSVLVALAWIGPNVFGVTALFFALGAVTRRMFPIYIGGVFLFVGYLGASAFTADLDNRTIAAMIDPFGSAALDELTRYWTPVEQNTLVPWPSGVGLANRALWTALSVLSLVVAWPLVRLDEFGWQPFQGWRRGTPEPRELDVPVTQPVPVVARRFDSGATLAQVGALTRRSVGDVLGHRYFWAFIAAALLFQLLNAQNIGSFYGTETWPVTYQVIEMLEGTLGLFTVIILTFYAGDLVWREREERSDQLLDTTPLSDGLPIFAKTLALMVVLAGLHTTVMVLGPLVQLAEGWTRLELGLYVQWLYGLSFIDWIPMLVTVFAIHVAVNQKVAGHAAVIGLWMVILFRGGWGFELNLPWIGADPGRTYSDMNGWGFSLGPFLLYKAYWLAFSGLVLGITRLLWVRGTDNGFRQRLAEARRRFDRPTGALIGGSLAAFVGLGGGIAWATLGVHGYETSVQAERDLAAYERTYKQTWEGAPHPEIVDLKLRVDLYPSQGRAVGKGTIELVNPHATPITRMLVNFADEDDVVSVALSPNTFTDVMDEELEVHVWTLEPPLEPGARATLSFEVHHGDPGIPNSGFETAVVENGTFLYSSVFVPHFGYSRDYEIADPADRRKQDLPERARALDLDDPAARRHSYLGDQAHLTPFEVRLSTEAGQIPLAPGSIVEEGLDGDRPWRLYRADRPIHFFHAFLSAAWDVRRRDDGPVPVEVYFDPAHPFNVDRMLDATVKSLRVFERDFSPFQHEVLRIVEFPRYASFAQSFPTLVPFSESIGFIARLEDPEEDIDYPFYVTAHEVAHQWWAHQVIAGDGQGATLLSESLSQYGALKVMEEEYGKDHIRRFLEYESDRYFGSRGFEREAEQPLMRVENQAYVHYNKGGHVLYALSERVGRTRFDAAIRTFLERWAFAGPPYPIARDFVDHLKVELPEHEKAIMDAFERIVLYDLRVTEASAKADGDGWIVRLTPKARTLVLDAKGVESEEPFADDVELEVAHGAGPASEHVVRLNGNTPVEVRVSELPTAVNLDPRALYLDRDRDDNEADLP